MGRKPLTPGDRCQVLSVSIPTKLLTRLADIADRKGVSVSSLIRGYVEQSMGEDEAPQKPRLGLNERLKELRALCKFYTEKGITPDAERIKLNGYTWNEYETMREAEAKYEAAKAQYDHEAALYRTTHPDWRG